MWRNIFSGNNRGLALMLSVLVGFIICYHVGTALKGHGRYRDQHLGTALHYAATQVDLQHTVIVGFNATETPTIQELPVWQMAVGLVFKHFGTWWGWANVVSLLLFFSSLYPLFRMVQMFYGDRTAWWALIFFLSQALVFLYAGEAGTDGLSLALAIWFGFACAKLWENPVKWFLPAAALGTLTALSKLPFFMAVGLGSFFLLLKVRGFKLREIAVLAGVGAVAGICFLLWTHYTDALQAGAVFPFVDLRLNSPSKNGMSMMFWYFGDWHYRLNPGNWIKAAWRFGGAAFGSFSLIALFVYAFASRRVHPAAKLLFAGSFLTTLVFSHLILHHYHYLMLYSPATAILCAAALVKIENFLSARGVKLHSIQLTAFALILAGLFQGLMSMRAFSFDPFPAMMATAIKDHTLPADKLVVVNGGWGGDELIRAGRSGLSMWDAKAFEDAEAGARLKQLGFNRLVIISEAPFQNAVQIINPGQTGIPRLLAKDYMTPLVEKWPTVYATEDIIIKAIP